MSDQRTLNEWAPSADTLESMGIAAKGASITLLGPRTNVFTGQRYPLVVFRPPALKVSGFKWSITTPASVSASPVPLQEASGQVTWRPSEAGRYRVTVAALADSAPIDTAFLEYEVTKPDEIIASIETAGDPRMVPVGDRAAFLRVALDLFLELFDVYDAGADLELRQYLSLPLFISYCYTALAIHSSATGNRRVESLITKAQKKLVVPAGGSPALAAWTGEEREGCFGLRLSYAAAYAELLAVDDLTPAIQRRLIERFRGIGEDARIALINDLRFPSTCARRALQAFSWCLTSWRELAANPELGLKPPEECPPEQREAILATLVDSGGPSLVARDSRSGDFAVSSFGRAVQENKDRPTFTLLFPVDDAIARKSKSEWAAAGALPGWDEIREGFAGGLLNYIYLRPHYVTYFKKASAELKRELAIDQSALGEGPADLGPIGWLTRNVKLYRFAGRPIQLHRAAGERLAKAEQRLTANHVAFSPTDVGGFYPRLINQGGVVLSNHALGLGIDFDPAANPMLVSDHLSCLADLVGPAILTDRSHAVSDATSKKFRELIQPLVLLVQSNPEAAAGDPVFLKLWSCWSSGGKDLFVSFKAGGLLTIPLEVVKAFRAEGLGWGGYYANKRDYMHFEYPVIAEPPDGER